jgi:hypothetical protein
MLYDGFGLGSGWCTAGTGWTLDQSTGGGNEESANESWAQTTGQSTNFNVVASAVGGIIGIGPYSMSGVSLKPSSSPVLYSIPLLGAGPA